MAKELKVKGEIIKSALFYVPVISEKHPDITVLDSYGKNKYFVISNKDIVDDFKVFFNENEEKIDNLFQKYGHFFKIDPYAIVEGANLIIATKDCRVGSIATRFIVVEDEVVVIRELVFVKGEISFTINKYERLTTDAEISSFMYRTVHINPLLEQYGGYTLGDMGEISTDGNAYQALAKCDLTFHAYCDVRESNNFISDIKSGKFKDAIFIKQHGYRTPRLESLDDFKRWTNDDECPYFNIIMIKFYKKHLWLTRLIRKFIKQEFPTKLKLYSVNKNTRINMEF